MVREVDMGRLNRMREVMKHLVEVDVYLRGGGDIDEAMGHLGSAMDLVRFMVDSFSDGVVIRVGRGVGSRDVEQ